MNPFVEAQTRALIENIRLLEAVVTSPLGLYSDIKMLREGLSFPEAAELSRTETQERRSAIMSMTDTPLELALETIESLTASINFLTSVKSDGSAPLESGWVSGARMVLARAEERVAGDLRSKIGSGIKGLYVIVDPEAAKGRGVTQIAEAVLKGGASVVQLRDKTRDKGEVLPDARKIKSLCDSRNALFIMNDDASLAFSSGASGLHVGQSDLPIEEARKVLKPRQLVGRSNNSMNEAMESQADGADYIAVGAVFSTATMGKGARQAVGTTLVSRVKERVDQPVVAIGGINASNVAEVMKAGADCVCVVSAITYADDPEVAAREIAQAIQNAK